MVICEHLVNVGLKPFIAENGSEGVEIVKRRLKTGKKQFSLIFMDIHMPEMDGLEAAAKIREFDASIPVVAMTANVLSEEREIYHSAGMKDIVGKPFTSQDLWRCLMKYIKPVNMQQDDTAVRKQADSRLHNQLVKSFLRNNKDVYEKLRRALDANDIKLAHRLAHTLKSNAGQLEKTKLQHIAKEVEEKLKTGENLVLPAQLKALENELNAVLAEFADLIKETEPVTGRLKMLSDTAANTLLKELDVLLSESNFDSMLFVDDLKAVRGSEILVEQIENLDFRLAHVTLQELIKQYKNDTGR